MKQALKLLLLLFLAATVAGMLRGFFRGLSWAYWLDRIPDSPLGVLQSVVGVALLEFLYSGIGYVVVNGLFLLHVKGAYKDTITLKAALLLGSTYSLGGYLVLAGTESWLSPGLANPFVLAGIYAVTGLVYGLLYHRWIIAIKAKAVGTSLAWHRSL